MFFLTITCVLVLGLYLLPLWRDQGGRGLAALSPAVLATAWLILLENHLVNRPDILPDALAPLLFSQYLLGPAWLLFSLSYGRELRWAELSAAICTVRRPAMRASISATNFVLSSAASCAEVRAPAWVLVIAASWLADRAAICLVAMAEMTFERSAATCSSSR